MAVELRFGAVAEIDEKTARVRLKYDDRDGSLSPWLFVSQQWTTGNRSYDLPDIGGQVGALVDTDNETGMIVGGIYSDADAPPLQALDKWARHFSDGGKLEYNRTTHELSISGCTVKITGDLSVTGKVGATGNVEAGGDVTASGTSLKTHVHSNGNMGSPTGPPM